MRGPVRSEENRAAGARVATCGIQPAPAALARGRTGGCGVTGSQIRVGDLSVSAGSQVHMGGICPCLRRRPVTSTGSQIRGGFRDTHPCLPTSPLGLRRSDPRYSLNYWVPGALTSLITSYIQLASPPLTPRNAGNPTGLRSLPCLALSCALLVRWRHQALTWLHSRYYTRLYIFPHHCIRKQRHPSLTQNVAFIFGAKYLFCSSSC